MKRILPIFLLLLTGFGLYNCNICNCQPTRGSFFRFTAIDAFNYREVLDSSPVAVPEGEVVSYQEYVLGMNGIIDYYGNIKSREEPSWQFPSLISSAYACSCDFDGSQGMKERINSLTFIARSNYNTQYNIGDTLNAIVTSYNGVDGLNVDDWLSQFSGPLYDYQYFFQLSEAPTDSAAAQQFEIILALNNGEVFRSTTDAVLLF